mgnify:CR=1 FL=1
MLLVDDNEELRELLGGYLTRFNIASEAVGNGAAMRLALAGGHFDAVILDLRNNSGGLLSQAISMTDAFLSRGDVVAQAYKDKEPVYRTAKAANTERPYPLILLADEASASAAEIVIEASRTSAITEEISSIARAVVLVTVCTSSM